MHARTHTNTHTHPPTDKRTHTNTHAHPHPHIHTHTHPHTHTHTHTTRGKMADEANLQLESALNTLISITDRSGNLRKDLKRDIVESVSTLRDIFVNLKNCAEEHIKKIALLESEVKNAKAELQEKRAVNLSLRVLPSMDGTGNIPAPSVKQGQPSLGGAR